MRRVHAAIVGVASALLISILVSAQPITNGGGLRLVTHGSAMTGSGTIAAPLDLRHDCSSGSGVQWSGTAWICAPMGGLTTAGSGLGSSGSTVFLNITPTSCTAGSGVTGINSLGSATCTADVVSVAAGTGISASTTSGAATVTANLAGASCAAGSAMTALGATGTGTCSTLATIGAVAGTGTSGRSSRWTSGTAQGTGAWTDDGTNATANGNVVSTAGTTTVGNFSGLTITPALTGGATVNDWAPTGNGTAVTFFTSCPSSACTITGLTGGRDGRKITIYNTGAGEIDVPNNNSGSIAGNRFNNSEQSGTIIMYANQGCAADFTYSTADNFWHETSMQCARRDFGATSFSSGGLQSYFGFGGGATTFIRGSSVTIGDGGATSGVSIGTTTNPTSVLGAASFTATTLPVTMSNQPIGGAGTATGTHWEDYQEFMLGGASYASGTPFGQWEYVNSGGTGYAESNVYDISGGGVPTGRPGVLDLSYTVSSPASGYTLINMTNGVTFSDGSWSMDGAIAVSALSSAVNSTASLYGFWFGFNDALSAASLPANGCYFQYLGNISTTNLSCACAKASTRTTYSIAGAGNSDESFPLGTSTVAATTWKNLRVKMTGTTRAEFYDANVKVCDINTNVPTGTAGLTSPRIVLSTAQTTGTAARALFVDWVRVAVDLTTARSP